MPKKLLLAILLAGTVFTLSLLASVYQFSGNSLLYLFPSHNLNKDVVARFEQNKNIVIDNQEIEWASMVGLYLENVKFVPVSIRDQELINLELQFLVYMNDSIKELNVSTVMPFYNAYEDYLFPEDSQNYFQEGKYYSLTLANYTSELTQDQQNYLCQMRNQMKREEYSYCIARLSTLSPTTVDEVRAFLLSERKSLTLNSVWLLRIDELFVNIEK